MFYSYISLLVWLLYPHPCVFPMSHSVCISYVPLRVCLLYRTPCVLPIFPSVCVSYILLRVSAISHTMCVSHIPLRMCLLYSTLCGSLRVFYSYISLCMCPTPRPTRCGSHFVCVLLSYPYAILFVCSTPYVLHSLCVFPCMFHLLCVLLRVYPTPGVFHFVCQLNWFRSGVRHKFLRAAGTG